MGDYRNMDASDFASKFEAYLDRETNLTFAEKAEASRKVFDFIETVKNK